MPTPEQAAARPRLGAQLWVDQDDDPARVKCLVSRAAEAGLGLLRVFLMWPWIEPEPGRWEFGVYDAAFDAAAEHGIGIKATLTANSGPWGTVASGPKVPPAGSKVEPLPVQTTVRSAQSKQFWHR